MCLDSRLPPWGSVSREREEGGDVIKPLWINAYLNTEWEEANVCVVLLTPALVMSQTPSYLILIIEVVDGQGDQLILLRGTTLPGCPNHNESTLTPQQWYSQITAVERLAWRLQRGCISFFNVEVILKLAPIEFLISLHHFRRAQCVHKHTFAQFLMEKTILIFLYVHLCSVKFFF